MPNKMVVTLSKLGKPDYEGSVQRLFYLESDQRLMVCETTSGGSVFDVGTIFSIQGSDRCRAAIRHKIFMLLESPDEWKRTFTDSRLHSQWDKSFLEFLDSGLLRAFQGQGAPTHHIGMVDERTGQVSEKSFPQYPSTFVVVRRYQILKPVRFSTPSTSLWDYSMFHHNDQYVIPLENIVRFGLTSGSSIYRKYLGLSKIGKKAYLEELGLTGDMQPWTTFPRPIVDFTTKFEPDDRNIDLQEALYISGQRGSGFVNMMRMSIFGSLLVSEFFGKLGLFLWDIKWEMAKDEDQLIYVDTIDTDSIRVTAKLEYRGSWYHVHFNKQAMRDYYKIIYPEWYAAVNEAKRLALKSGKAFHEHLEEGQEKGIYPGTPEVDPVFAEIQKGKFETILAYLVDGMAAEEASVVLKEIGLKEIAFYERSKAFDTFCSLNRA